MRTLRIGLFFVAAAISGLASISGIAVDKAGNVYFSDWTANKIWKIDPQGNAEVVAQKHTHHLFIDAEGNLYGEHVAQEGGAASLWKRTPQGQLVDVIPAPQPGQSPIFEGGAFTISRDGSVITPIGCRMWIISGVGIAQWAGANCGEREWKDSALRFGHLHGSMAWAPDGSLYFTDARTVRKIAPNGATDTLDDKPASLFSDPRPGELKFNRAVGLGAGQDGIVYVADEERGILKVNPSTGAIEVLKHPSWFWEPTGLTVSNSDVYVVENRPDNLALLGAVIGNPRVTKLSPNGTSVTLFTVSNATARAVTALVILLALALYFWLRRRRSSDAPDEVAN